MAGWSFTLSSAMAKAGRIISLATKRDRAHCVQRSYEHGGAVAFAAQAYCKRKNDLYFPVAFRKFEPLASESKSLDGLNIHCGIIDELHAIRTATFTMDQTVIAVAEQSLLSMITTAGFVRECIYDDIYEICLQGAGLRHRRRAVPSVYLRA